MATILAKKAGYEVPTALDDEHYDALASDPSIQQFPQGSSYGSNTSFGGASTFGQSSAGGFGTSSPGFGAVPPAPSTSYTPAPSWGTTPVSTGPAVVAGFGGKPAPAQEPQPLL